MPKAPPSPDAIAGFRLAELREAAGLTRYALAKQSGVNATYLGRLEKGEQGMSLETAQRLCAVLGVSLAEFDTAEIPK